MERGFIFTCPFILINNARDAVEIQEHPRILIRLTSFRIDGAFVNSRPYLKLGDYARLSVEGKGICFHVYLPLLKTEAGAAVADQQHSTAEGRGELILLVDDQQTVPY